MPTTRLSDDESYEIYREHSRGDSYASLGKRFGISWQGAYYHAKKWETIQEIKETGY